VARFNVITNWSNGVGLQRDAEMLRAELSRRGHMVNPIHYQAPEHHEADVNVFLEVIEFKPSDPARHVPFEQLSAMAPRQWLVPNPEWFYSSWPLEPWELVLTKTHDATRIFRALVGDRCEYLGWQAHDFYDPTIPRTPRFLHIAGKSQAKNTTAVIDGVRRTGVPLTLVCSRQYPVPASVTWHSRVSEDDLRHMLNAHAFCLLPSAYEGYGHSLHEAHGCGQIVLTTDAAPMNETQPIVPIRPHGGRPQRLAFMHDVTGKGVAKAITAALALTTEQRQEMSQQIRAAFEAERATFHANLDRLLEAHL
jgi:hypothetical protein